MKLSPSEIEAIEKFITAREKGMSNTAIGLSFGLGAHSQQKASVTFKVLGLIGVQVGKTPPKVGWKKRERPVAVKPMPVKQSRRFATAEEWQERLSVLGH